ncbi:hypothetical protein [Microbacterium sp. H6]|uniref:hypothetical protein n=1 Tax=Microbacterium sp. H6 TaxID=421122 RepID=UPI000DE51779|nr:hypothetical protein [Microbacterium sp. H6]RBO73477.1 hypothetical protein DSP71_04800 [Microbacterium sp. H6]
MLLQIALWVAAVWMAFSALAVISQIGKPRAPITPGTAIFSLIVTVLIIVTLIAAALQHQ